MSQGVGHINVFIVGGTNQTTGRYSRIPSISQLVAYSYARSLSDANVHSTSDKIEIVILFFFILAIEIVVYGINVDVTHATLTSLRISFFFWRSQNVRRSIKCFLNVTPSIGNLVKQKWIVCKKKRDSVHWILCDSWIVWSLYEVNDC